MYRVISEGKVVSLCDEPHYVKKSKNGSWITCKESEAEAIVACSELYNLPGQSHVADRPEATIDVVDGGEFIFKNYINLDSYRNEIETLEDALCEIDKGDA